MTAPHLGETPVGEQRAKGELDARADALRALRAAGVPHLVAGAYALFAYTGIYRDTKDLDVFLRRHELDAALAALDQAGFRTELLDAVWIAKAWRGEWFVDLIFSSGNGVATVDDDWFANAREAVVMGEPVLLAPPEEMIWSKGYVLERERYDGHDVAHLIRSCGRSLSWKRLLARFGADWEVLLSQLLVFRFSFPSDRTQVPDWVMLELLRRALEGVQEGDWERPVCRGPLLSKHQYRHALERLGYEDVRGLGSARPGVAGRDREESAHGEGLSPGGGG